MRRRREEEEEEKEEPPEEVVDDKGLVAIPDSVEIDVIVVS